MGRLPTVGLVQRGAQLPKPDIFRMALRKRSAGNRDRCGGKCRHLYASCPPHLTSSWLRLSPDTTKFTGLKSGFHLDDHAPGSSLRVADSALGSRVPGNSNAGHYPRSRLFRRNPNKPMHLIQGRSFSSTPPASSNRQMACRRHRWARVSHRVPNGHLQRGASQCG